MIVTYLHSIATEGKYAIITTVAVTVVTVLLFEQPIPRLADTLGAPLDAMVTVADVAFVCHELFESSEDEEWFGFCVVSGVELLAIFQLR